MIAPCVRTVLSWDLTCASRSDSPEAFQRLCHPWRDAGSWAEESESRQPLLSPAVFVSGMGAAESPLLELQATLPFQALVFRLPAVRLTMLAALIGTSLAVQGFRAAGYQAGVAFQAIQLLGCAASVFLCFGLPALLVLKNRFQKSSSSASLRSPKRMVQRRHPSTDWTWSGMADSHLSPTVSLADVSQASAASNLRAKGRHEWLAAVCLLLISGLVVTPPAINMVLESMGFNAAENFGFQ